MEALQNGQATVEGSIEGQSAGAASHAMIEKILSEEPRWQGKGGHPRQAPTRRVLTPLLPKGSAPHHLCREGVPSHPLTSSQAAPGPLLGEFPQTCLALLPSSQEHPRFRRGFHTCILVHVCKYVCP